MDVDHKLFSSNIIVEPTVVVDTTPDYNIDQTTDATTGATTEYSTSWTTQPTTIYETTQPEEFLYEYQWSMINEHNQIVVGMFENYLLCLEAKGSKVIAGFCSEWDDNQKWDIVDDLTIRLLFLGLINKS